MAGATLLSLLDDIAALMDDVSVMTKVAARKTAGVLGDDLAVNAEKVTGVAADRELPVVFAVFRGSLLNKAILVPAAILIAAIAEWLIAPLLMAGGLYLCYEGFEKVWHFLSHSRDERHAEHEKLREQLEDPDTDPVKLERRRIRGAIRTDFILSAEIIVITLGIVGEATLATRAMVLSTIALVMTFGVYGIVAAIVKVDDLGLHLLQGEGQGMFARLGKLLGRGLLAFAPRLMQFLTVFGTLAMFLVGGGILVHGIPQLHHIGLEIGQWGGGGLGPALLEQLYNAAFGMVAGGVALLLIGLLPKRSA